ncbi:MAG TPA: phospholipid carrier-dependent glycosyltransferase [Steroidobacteraceae bacterium]|nr:phospholipid carrier-dependent glycosyltransferase [Steroidobacteraceae bacterium]
MRTATLSLWLVLGALWLASMPLRPLFDPDEGRYAEIPREMAASGDWITPTLNDVKYFEKPPLQYWATAALYSVFGVQQWTARLYATVLAFLCIPLVFGFCRLIGYATDTSLVAAALLATNPYFAITGQLNLLDQGFTFFLCAALFAFVIAQLAHDSPARLRNWMLITWAALGLAVLSKGIVTLVLAGATLTVYMAATRDLSPLRRLQLRAGVPLFLVITVPWFWLIQRRNPEFFQFFFVREHFERYLTTVADRVEPFWYFIPIVAVALLPVLGNWRSWTLAKIEGERSAGEFRAELFLLTWCAVVIVLFSLSQSKLATYVMPIMPPLAVALARVTRGQADAFPRAKWLSIGFLLLIAATLAFLAWRRMGSEWPSSLAWAIAAGVLCIGYVIFDGQRSRLDLARRWSVLAAVSIACYQILAMCYAATFPARSGAAVAAQIGASIDANTALYSVGQYRHSVSFYLRRPLFVYDYRGELEFGLSQAGITLPAQDRGKFLECWQAASDAIAFIDPRIYASLAAAGMSGRIVARDAHSIVVARS